MPEMARLLGVKRNTVYSILKNPQYKDMFEIVIVADRKKITRDSFECFLVSQEKYTLDKVNLKYLTYQEAAVVAKVSRSTIYDWINKKCFPVTYVMNIARIPRQEFELFLKKREEGGNVNHGINSRKKR